MIAHVSVAPGFQPSTYQQRIFQFIQSGTGHGVIDAVPGSGKTTTLMQAANLLPKDARALFVAFNVHIARELGEKLKALNAPMRCSTIHSLGKRLLGKARVEERKYRWICKDYLLSKGIPHGTDHLSKLVDFVRLTLTDATSQEALIDLITHYDLDIEVRGSDWQKLWPGVAPVLKMGAKLAEPGTSSIIDFTDMIYLPTVLSLPCPAYDYLFVDECQDLNAAQLALLMRCCSRGRMLYVGDRRQSLYGFAGADTRSVEQIIERTHATVLPLSICYRCPSSVVNLAGQVFPGIKPSPKASRGTVAIIAEGDLKNMVQPEDMVLCRTTAPLVEQCLALLRAGIKAMMRGKDLGKIFTDLLTKLSERPKVTFETLGKAINDYRQEQVSVLSVTPDNEMKLASMHDQMDTLLKLLEAYRRKAQRHGTFQGFEAYLGTFFKNDEQGPPPVLFSTVHRAKGLEANRVFLLRPDLIPHPAAKKEWQIEQEYNIEYVALTRAKKALYFVDQLIDNLTLPY